MSDQPNIELLLKECIFDATRSSGSGGQNVNKVSTKVILQFNVLGSNYLSEEQKDILLSKLRSRISKTGILRLTSGRGRTQLANRKLVTEKYISLVINAFTAEPDRIATLPTESSKQKRISKKKLQSEKKATRSERWDGET
jgi:ribosome-associated protein